MPSDRPALHLVISVGPDDGAVAFPPVCTTSLTPRPVGYAVEWDWSPVSAGEAFGQ